MKKFLCTLLCLMLVFTMMPMATGVAFANVDVSFTVDGINYKVTSEGETNTVEVGNNQSTTKTNIIIPATVTSSGTDYTVTSIGKQAFSNCSSLVSIAIPEGLTTIDRQAFLNCASLTSITIPTSVTTIINNAFKGCASLESITIPKGVTQISADTFNGCKALKSIEIPASVTSICLNAFAGCSNLATVTFAEGSELTRIDNNAFANCTFTSIEIPTKVTSIGQKAFNGCSNLATVACLATTPPTLGDNLVFNLCASLTSIYVPTESVASYTNATYWSQYKNEIKGCWLIGTAGHESDVIAYLDNGTLHIEGTGAMQDFDIPPWYSLKSSVTSIAIGQEITSIGGYAFYGTAITSVSVPRGVVRIGERAFNNCESLTSVNISDTVTEIGAYEFVGSNNINSITIEATTPPTLLGNLVYYDGVTNYYVYVPSTAIKAYKNDSSWNDYYQGYSYFNHLEPNIHDIGDVLDFVVEGFPYSNSDAPDNAWLSSNGTKVFKKSSAITIENGNSSLSLDLTSPVTKSEDSFKYSNNGATIEFIMDDDYDLTSIVITNAESIDASYINLNGTCYNSNSIAVALLKADGGFPTSSATGWNNGNNVYLYENNDLLLFNMGNELPLAEITENLDNDDKFVFEGVTLKFNIKNDKLESITVTGMPDPFGAANGTYSVAGLKPKPTPSTGGGSYFNYEDYKKILEEAQKQQAELDAKKAEEEKLEKHEELVKEAKTELTNVDLKTSSKLSKLNGKKAITLTWNVTDGELALNDFEGFDIFRSTKRNSGYGKTPYFTTTKTSYTNNKGLKNGKTYYYKVRAWKMVDGEKVYTGWSTKAWRTVK